jgi:DNA-directed RNA polymerase specialized sigma24 family protein
MTKAHGGESEPAGGEPGTIEWLLQKVQPKVRRLALRLLSSPAEADEVSSETGLLLWHHIEVEHKQAMPQNEAELPAVERWACRVAQNSCIDILRSRRRSEEACKPTNLEPVPTNSMEGRFDARRALKLLNLSKEEEQLLLGVRQGPADARMRQQVKRLREQLRKRLSDVTYGMDGERNGS